MSVGYVQLPYSKGVRCCVVVGLGLVGEEILWRLGFECEFKPVIAGIGVDWRSYESVLGAIAECLPNENKDFDLDIIWAAGKQGFSASNDDMADEYRVYQAVISSLNERFQDRLSVRLISSAGGVYEGAGIISHIEQVNPVRPYGVFKLKQEKLLDDLGVRASVYRLSSVYGHHSSQSRVGLISALMASALTVTPATIHASESTMRDYLYNRDVAREVVKDLSRDHPRLKLLAAGTSISVDSLIKLISSLMGRKARVIYRANSENNSDMVFGPSLIPEGFSVTSIQQGVMEMKSKRATHSS